MARFYANENIPHPVAQALRELGHDVLTVAESRRDGAPLADAEVLAFAAKERRLLVTLNRRHFIRLHSQDPRHAGIVVCTFDADFTRQAKRIDAAVRGSGDTQGKLIRVSRPA